MIDREYGRSDRVGVFSLRRISRCQRCLTRYNTSFGAVGGDVAPGYSILASVGKLPNIPVQNG